MHSLDKLLAYLCQKGYLDEDIELSLKGKQDRGDFVVDYLLKWLPLKEVELKELIEKFYSWPLFLDREVLIDRKLPFWLDAGLSHKLRCIPLSFDGYNLQVGVDDPFFVPFWQTLEYDLNFKLKVFLLLRKDFLSLYRQLYNRQPKAFEEEKETKIDLLMPWELENEKDDLNEVLEEAIKANATDIHFEPLAVGLRVRFRVDGTLRLHRMFNEEKKKELIARLKVWSELNVSQQRLPQDGQFQRNIQEETIDFRLSTLPLIHGEKAVIRILRKEVMLKSPLQLGMSEKDLRHFLSVLKKPQGMILVCGPTASGKTTTMYCAIEQLPKDDLNIVTIENPVEYRISGIQQMQVNHKIGATFAEGLRAILRQDPDVILLGEIRDKETAEVAFQAALTGHLVLASLHTEDASGAITRLLDMGIEPYLLTSTITCIVAQRLVKKLCPNCGLLENVDFKTVEKFPFVQSLDKYKQWGKAGLGCERCDFSSYSGRIGLFELLLPSDEINTLIMKKAPLKILRQKAYEEGSNPIVFDGFKKACEGITTLQEILPLLPEF